MRLSFAGIILSAAAGLLLSGCGQGGRKKMPALTNGIFDGVTTREQYEEAAQALATDTTLFINGRVAHYLAVHLPGGEDQLQALLQQYGPYASDYLPAWSLLGKEGVIINVSGGSEGCIAADEEGSLHETGFELQGTAQHFSIPLLLVWDSPSAPRAAAIRALLNNLPAIRCEGRDISITSNNPIIK